MTDKEKLDAIRAEIHRLVDVRGYDRGMANDVFAFMDSLPNEPVSGDFEMALAEMIGKAQTSVVEPWVIAAQWKDELIKLAKSEEPISEDLEEAATKYAQDKYMPVQTSQAFKAGAKWQKKQMMAKTIDGDDDKTYGCIAHDSFCLEDFGLKDFDKVKMILIKED